MFDDGHGTKGWSPLDQISATARNEGLDPYQPAGRCRRCGYANPWFGVKGPSGGYAGTLQAYFVLPKKEHAR